MTSPAPVLDERLARVLIVDAQPNTRDVLRAQLTQHEVEVVAALETPRLALDLLGSRPADAPVDVAIVDVHLPDPGAPLLAKRIVDQYPQTAVLILTQVADVEFVSRMLQAGAHGYVLKGAEPAELVLAVNRLAAGQRYYSSEVTYGVISHFLNGGSSLVQRPSAAKLTNSPLTKREQEIIRMIANQMTNQEIADRLGISLRTVDTHRRNLLQKLGVKNTAGLVRYAVQQNLVD